VNKVCHSCFLQVLRFYLHIKRTVVGIMLQLCAPKISQQPENCENRNDPDLVQAFLKKWWVESDFKAPNLPLSLRFKGSGSRSYTMTNLYSNIEVLNTAEDFIINVLSYFFLWQNSHKQTSEAENVNNADKIIRYLSLRSTWVILFLYLNTVTVTAGTFEPQWEREVWCLKIWFNPPFL
jgi:hypothetical protein